MNLSTIDPNLPALGHLFDWPAITKGFLDHQYTTAGDAVGMQPANAGVDGWQVQRMQHLHYQPGQNCMATYELCQVQPGRPARHTFGVVECTPQGLTHRFFQQDPVLPWLATAIDGQVMGNRLASLEQTTTKGHAPAHCVVTPIRYRPGKRCAVRYNRMGAGVEQQFFGKLFHQDDTQRMATLPTLYARTQTTPELPRLPQPLAYWPDLHLLIQPVVQGAEFHTVVFSEEIAVQERVLWFHRMGTNLAALHRLDALDLPQRTIADDLAELHSYTSIIAQVMPSLAATYSATLQALTLVAQGLPAVKPVVCHGALRTDQWLITKQEQATHADEQLMLIDLDTLCLANPACDLGNCLAYLQWKAIRQPQYVGFIQAAERALLTGYAIRQSPPAAAWIALCRAVALLKIAGRRFRSLTYREWSLTPQLVQAAPQLFPPIILPPSLMSV